MLDETRGRWAAGDDRGRARPAHGRRARDGVAPGFDANRYPAVPRDRQRNRAVTDTYEPGSTFKVVTLSAVLETGMVTPSTRYTLPTRSRSPTGRSTTPSRGGRRR